MDHDRDSGDLLGLDEDHEDANTLLVTARPLLRIARLVSLHQSSILISCNRLYRLPNPFLSFR